MNKLVKGSIAGAAGIALLLGGAGTFALWNDSAALTAATVSTGELDIDLTATAAVWNDVSTKTVGGVTTSSVLNGATFNPATHKLVPGDTVTYTKEVTIKANGKNLAAKLAYVPGSVVIDPTLAPFVTVTVGAPTGLPASWSAVATTPADGSYIITPSTTVSTATFNVVLTVKFLDTAANQVGQNLTAVNLTGAAFSLTQVRQ
ncbi:alternate-type signal peptide domain-containing protein [Glaciihabitans arcticus]|uniref:Alternate-type signal peptide domain-containing protein n=1 Tax=Glaciihabitans arcticus TaxID=2668039 RepID=A0A4Q9GND0_9MICO|nr:alternate-type signal peptide domain-containing protein [Glaciihabitans arcticus]TBN56216.1 alternate-type signal peptide domain-containing protein [Glaciihabitans arcticus]